MIHRTENIKRKISGGSINFEMGALIGDGSSMLQWGQTQRVYVCSAASEM